MPELPSAETVYGQRRAPRPQRAVQGYRTGDVEQAQVNAGKALAEQADEYDKLFEERKQEKDKLDIARAQSYALQKTTELETNLLQDPDYATHPEKWQKGFNEIRAGALSMVPADKRELFDIALNDMNTASSNKIKRSVYDMQGQALAGEAVKIKDAMTTTAATKAAMGDEPGALASIQTAYNAFEAAQRGGAYRGMADNGASIGDALRAEMAEAVLANVPAKDRVKMYESGIGASEAINTIDIIKDTVAIEGGYSASDGASGSPVIYGINSKYHPDEYKEALKITQEKGDQAGKDYAAQFYKKEYADRYELDQFPPDVRRVLFDGVINHHSKFRDELIAAAKGGASANDLIEMRRTEYNRLGKNEAHSPSVEGWMNRLETVKSKIGGTAASNNFAQAKGLVALVPAEKRMKMYEDAKIEHVYSMIDNDPVAALDGLNKGTLGAGLDPSKIKTLKEQASVALDNFRDTNVKAKITEEIMADRERLGTFFTNDMTLADISKIEAAEGETSFTRWARTELTKDVPDPTDGKKAEAFVELNDDLNNLRVKMGGVWDGEGKITNAHPKFSVDFVKQFKAFHNKVMSYSEAKLIEPSEAQKFLNNFSAPIMDALSKNQSDTSGWGRGVQDPYGVAFKSLDGLLKDSFMGEDLVAKKELTMLFSDYLGDYSSKGNGREDKAVIANAVMAARDAYNEKNYPEVALMEVKPNYIISAKRPIDGVEDQEIITVTNDKEYEAVPSGLKYRAPDGKIRTKK